MKKIYIFGAHSRAQTLNVYLEKLYPEIENKGYIIDNDEINEVEIGGIPVFDLNKVSNFDVSATVYIGTRGINHNHAIDVLSSTGFKNIVPVTLELDMQLRNAFLNVYFKENGRKFIKLEDKKTVSGERLCSNATLYVIKSIFDSPLKKSADISQLYEKDLQVGAALTNERIAELTDNIGDNISEMNKQFCELTGLFWIWKNSIEDIVGIEHYRRRFILSSNWYDVMKKDNIDVILPVPLYVAPSLAQNYKNRHVESDWVCLMNLLKKRYPEDYNCAMDFFEGTAVYSPCNMLIAKKEVLNNLCEWMFPLLFDLSKHIGSREDKYQNRYPGFASERLITFFFEKNRNKYNVVYADKDFRM